MWHVTSHEFSAPLQVPLSCGKDLCSNNLGSKELWEFNVHSFNQLMTVDVILWWMICKDGCVYTTFLKATMRHKTDLAGQDLFCEARKHGEKTSENSRHGNITPGFLWFMWNFPIIFRNVALFSGCVVKMKLGTIWTKRMCSLDWSHRKGWLWKKQRSPWRDHTWHRRHPFSVSVLVWYSASIFRRWNGYKNEWSVDEMDEMDEIWCHTYNL